MKRVAALVLAGSLVVGLLVAGIALSGGRPTPVVTAQPSAAPTAAPTSTAGTGAPEKPSADARVLTIDKAHWQRIVATGTWRPGCPAGRDQLRSLEVNYWDFGGKVRRGALVVNADVASDLADIFTSLFDAGFPIARMRPVEQYGGDVYGSLSANNTSAFNCRRPGQINAPVKDSPHANGRAVDINPVQNPWRDPRCDCWTPSAKYARSSIGPGVIRADSFVVDLFEAKGWIWQNIKVPDYMHFDSGYPSRPVPARPSATSTSGSGIG